MGLIDHLHAGIPHLTADPGLHRLPVRGLAI